MKEYILLVYLLLNSGYILLGHDEQVSVVDNDSIEHKLPIINIPDIHGVQTVKALVKIKPHSTNKALTLIDSEFRYLPINESDNRQLWWIIQDYEYHAFAFSNASNTDLWLYYDASTENLSTVKSDNKTSDDPFLGEYMQKQYFFEFELFDPDMTSSYAIRSLYSKNYLQTTNLDSVYSNWRLKIGHFILNRNAMHFNIEVFKGIPGEEFVSLPMSETDDHTQIKDSLSLVKIKANHLITDNKAYLSSSYGFLLNKLGGEEMFKITFDSLVTQSMVGLLHYKAVPFSNSFYQKKGSRKPIAGIGVKDDTVYLFNKDNIVPTSFEKGVPIVFGYKNGELIANQSGDSQSIAGVPTPTLLNSTDGNKIKLLMRLPYGKTAIGYNPRILLFGHDFRGKDSVSTVMTNPYLSALEDPETRTTTFDWTAKTYDLRYKVNGRVVNEKALSPFYYDNEEFSGINAKHDFRGVYIGGEDFEYYDGWELIAHDFGYDQLGNKKSSSKLKREPYMILYNRYTSKIRVFVYMSNPTIANNLKITLSDGLRSGILEKYQPARLWGSYLQGRALDDPHLSNAEYSKMVQIRSTGTGFFCFADFTLSYSPCISKYESNLRITVSKITQGNLEIVGKTQGGVIPVNSPGISDWLSNSNHYLTGVLSTPYGELSTTLGDITFRNFNKWGAKDWGNTASFILPGKKIKDWEKEMTRLQYKGEETIASGAFISGAGRILVGSSMIATAFDITNISTKIAVGIGEIMDATGTIVRGNGRALIAAAIRLKYKNLKDEPDKNIRVTLPDSQPSVVFSELAAKGTLSIETLVFDDVVITTPGSKYSELAPNEYLNGSKGSYPLYNQSLGTFNLLYQPKVALSIVKQSKDIGGYIRLKKHPYIGVNGDVDYLGGFFMINYVVTTYDSLGYSTESRHSKPYLLTDRKIPGIRFLPMTLDISELLDKETLLANINQYTNSGGYDIESKLNDWVTVELEIEFFGYTGKNSDGTYGVSDLSNSYKSHQVVNYEDATGVDQDIYSLLANFSDLSFGNDYLGDDIELWEEHYLISSTMDGYSKKMDQYCDCNFKSEELRKWKTIRKDENSESEKDTKVNSTQTIEKKGILVYPNPSDGIFTIDYVPKETGKIILRIYDSNGNVLITHAGHASSTYSAKKAKINISYLKPGIYILEIRHKSGSKYIRKLIKN